MTDFTMTSSFSHKFDQASWRVIKEFSGIYGVKMDYSKIKNLSRDKLSEAYFKDGKQPLITKELSWNVTYDVLGNSTWGSDAFKQINATKSQGAKEWKATILKRAAQGYKNREFYEAVAKAIAPPKMKCVCGLMMGTNRNQIFKHYTTKSHINRMLKCVPVSSIIENTDEKWGPQNVYINDQLVNLKPFMKVRELTVSRVYDEVRPGNKAEHKEVLTSIDEILSGIGCRTFDDIVEGKWRRFSWSRVV